MYLPNQPQTDEELQPAACFVVRDKRTAGKPGGVPARVAQLSREVVVAGTGPPVREREIHIYATLGSGTYVLMCATFMAGMEGSFKVRPMKWNEGWIGEGGVVPDDVVSG